MDLTKRNIVRALERNGFFIRSRTSKEGVKTFQAIKDGQDASIEAEQFINAFDELPEVKADRIEEIKTDALERVQLVFPSIVDFDIFNLVKNIMESILPQAVNATSDMVTLNQIYQAAKTAIQQVNQAQTVEAVDNVTVGWPT